MGAAPAQAGEAELPGGAGAAPSDKVRGDVADGHRVGDKSGAPDLQRHSPKCPRPRTEGPAVSDHSRGVNIADRWPPVRTSDVSTLGPGFSTATGNGSRHGAMGLQARTRLPVHRPESRTSDLSERSDAAAILHRARARPHSSRRRTGSCWTPRPSSRSKPLAAAD